MILGHNHITHAVIREAVIDAAQRGSSFGAPTETEIKMAELVFENGSINGTAAYG